MTLLGLALREAVKGRARELGFDAVAVGPAGPPPHAGAFERWLAAGYAATMDYLERGSADRGDPERLLPGCRSVIAVALSYAREDDEPGWRGVARYARGHDYHELMRPRLAALAEFVCVAAGSDVRCRVAVDTSAILERDAALAPAGPLGPLEALLGLDRDAFRARFRHTPLWRAKRAGLLRNAALVLGNRGDARAAPALERALDDEDEAVRHAAAWALERLRRLES